MKTYCKEKIFYVYVYTDIRIVGEFWYGEHYFHYLPFYIGKGKGKRALDHLKNAMNNKKDCNHGKISIIKELLDAKRRVRIVKFADNLDEYTALKLEAYLIKLIGRKDQNKGPLTNLTDGELDGFLAGKNNPMWGRNDQCYKKGGLADCSRSRKGKTFEELYGEERALSMRKNLSWSSSRPFEERISKDKIEDTRKKLRDNNPGKKRKGKTNIEFYGEEKAKIIAKKYSESSSTGKGELHHNFVKLDIREICMLLEQGFLRKEIAQKLNVKPDIISKRLKESGLKLSDLAKTKNNEIKLDLNLIKDLYEKGVSLKDISSQLNVCTVTISKRIKKLKASGIIKESFDVQKS